MKLLYCKKKAEKASIIFTLEERMELSGLIASKLRSIKHGKITPKVIRLRALLIKINNPIINKVLKCNFISIPLILTTLI